MTIICLNMWGGSKLVINYKLVLERIKRYSIISDDIAWCKKVFKGSEFDFIDVSPIESLRFMMSCKYSIIANSTFSWWGAWLGQTKAAIVAPLDWFGPNYSLNNTNDLYTEGMIII